MTDSRLTYSAAWSRRDANEQRFRALCLRAPYGKPVSANDIKRMVRNGERFSRISGRIGLLKEEANAGRN